MSKPSPLCYLCRRFHGLDPLADEPFTCDAYPAGIPAGIMAGDVDHRIEFEGDNGLQFVAVSEAEAADYFSQVDYDVPDEEKDWQRPVD